MSTERKPVRNINDLNQETLFSSEEFTLVELTGGVYYMERGHEKGLRPFQIARGLSFLRAKGIPVESRDVLFVGQIKNEMGVGSKEFLPVAAIFLVKTVE